MLSGGSLISLPFQESFLGLVSLGFKIILMKPSLRPKALVQRPADSKPQPIHHMDWAETGAMARQDLGICCLCPVYSAPRSMTPTKVAIMRAGTQWQTGRKPIWGKKGKNTKIPPPRKTENQAHSAYSSAFFPRFRFGGGGSFPCSPLFSFRPIFDCVPAPHDRQTKVKE